MPVVAYIHNLSPIKTSQRNNQYFDVHLQTENKSIRTVCFSPEKHRHFKQKLESSSPVKISNYNLKRNARTNDFEIHINKRTKLDEPTASEVNFDFKPAPQPQLTPVKEIVDILQSDQAQCQVSVVGKIKFNGPIETIMTKGKYLKKQEASITDNSESICLVLWENDISKVQDDFSYKKQKVTVRVYNDEKYLTLNKNSIIGQIDQSFDREQTLEMASNCKTVQTPANGVTSTQRFMSCFKCKTKIVPTENELVKCSECGRAQLKAKCPTRLFSTVEFLIDDSDEVTLNLFEDKLQTIYELYRKQHDITKDFNEFTDEDIILICLKVSSTFFYNDKKNVIAIN